MVLKGHISTLDDVKRINEVASNMPFEVFVSSGNDMFDARSFLCLSAFIGKDVNIIVEDDIDDKVFAKMVKRMKV